MTEDKMQVLTSAFINILDSLEVSDSDISEIVGVDTTTINDYRSSARMVDPKSDEGKKIIAFISTVKGIYSLVGRNSAHAKDWLYKTNSHFKDTPPIAAMKSQEGLTAVGEYISKMNQR